MTGHDKGHFDSGHFDLLPQEMEPGKRESSSFLMLKLHLLSAASLKAER